VTILEGRESLPPSLRDAVVVATAKRRLGGCIAQVRLPDGRDAIVKTGRDAERIGLLREHRNTSALRGVLPVPTVIGFHDDGDIVALAETRLHGQPLHLACQERGRADTLALLAAVLNTMWTIPRAAMEMRLSVDEELADIAGLIRKGLLDPQAFQAASGGRTIEGAYAEVRALVATHDKCDFVHGDFCLPNIMVDRDGSWGLIDLGRSGFGDRLRDLASLEKSLRRNVDERAFADLLDRMKMPLRDSASEKMRAYALLDAFWEAMALAPIKRVVLASP
jgi:aminoglycoside phosphotransferase